MPEPLGTAITAHVHSLITSELAARLKDQSSLVRDIADKAEDVVWKRIARYTLLAGWLLAFIIGTLGFMGFKTLNDVSSRLEPSIKAADKKLVAVQSDLDKVQSDKEKIRKSIDKFGLEASAQIARLKADSSRITAMLKEAEAGVSASQQRGAVYETRVKELEQRISSKIREVETRVELATRQVDTITIKKALPTLGIQQVVTLNGQEWKAPTGNKLGVKWVSVYIDHRAISQVTTSQMELLVAEARKMGCMMIFGYFGIGGPFQTGVGAISESGVTEVVYFNKESESAAGDLAKLASSALRKGQIRTRFVTVKNVRPGYNAFVLENAGLDMQLVIQPQ